MCESVLRKLVDHIRITTIHLNIVKMFFGTKHLVNCLEILKKTATCFSWFSIRVSNANSERSEPILVVSAQPPLILFFVWTILIVHSFSVTL